MNDLPHVSDLRKMIEIANETRFLKVKLEADLTMNRLKTRIQDLLDRPEKYISHHSYIEELKVHGDDEVKKYFSYLEEVLVPLGYSVEKSHDGGGMYSTVCIGWSKCDRPERVQHIK